MVCRSSGDNGKGGYKYKNDIKLRFNADLGCYPPARMPADVVSNSSSNSNEDSSSTQYPQSEERSSPENSQSTGSSGRGDGQNSAASNDSSGESCDIQNAGSGGSKSNSQKKSAKETVPAFALHPSGLHYIPVVMHTDGLSGRIQETGVTVCHPISIPVNFGTPLVAVQNCHIESPVGNAPVQQAPMLTLPTATVMPPHGMRVNGMHSRKRSHQEHVSPRQSQAAVDGRGSHPVGSHNGGSYPSSHSGSPQSYSMNHSPPLNSHGSHSSVGGGAGGRIQHSSAPGSPYLSQHSTSSRLSQSGDRRALSVEDCHRVTSRHVTGHPEHVVSYQQLSPTHMFQNGRHVATVSHHGNMFPHPRMASPRAMPTEPHVQVHAQYSP